MREIRASEPPWTLPPESNSSSEPRADDELVLLLEDEAVYAYVLRDLFIMVWRGVVTDTTLEAMHKLMEREARKQPDGMAIVSVIERGATPPSSAQRSNISNFQARMGKRFRCLALVIDGIGFWASMAIGVATSIITYRRKLFPQTVCRTVEGAVDFIVRKSPGMDAQALLSAIAQCRDDAAMRAMRLESRRTGRTAA
ncbi:MAG TPA: hypothetical protein VMI75_22540 [Polyangiaceae bacterium]|nr:hypothetical protein [Polyangiaceae bacterium]